MAAHIANLGFSDNKTRRAMQGANTENFNPIINGRSIREPIRTVYIHSVAKRSFGPLSHLLFPKLVIRGCKNGERYVTAAKIGDPIKQASPDLERGGTRIDEEDAWRASIDLLNPSNPYNDPYWNNAGAIPAYFATNQNCDLISQGVFPSLNEVPTEEELVRAEEARDNRYRALAQRATELESVSIRDLNEFLQANPDAHQAMDTLGLSSSWHKKNEVRHSCPNCGESIKTGIAFHSIAGGTVLCIIDPEKAWKAGAIPKARAEELLGATIEEVKEKRGPGRPPKSL